MTERVLCQVCGRPLGTAVSLCREHVDELVGALIDLATGGPELERVHERRYLIGGRLVLDTIVTHPPGQRPGLLAELGITLSRQHKLGGAGVPTAGGAEPATLYHQAAAEVLHAARNILGTWARDHAQRQPHLTLPRTHDAAAAWLATTPGLLAEHPAAGEMHRDITGLVRRILAVIDRRIRVYLGMCSARLEYLGRRAWRLCETDLYAPRGATVMQCPTCGTTHDVAWRRDQMLLKVDYQLANATDASRALSTYEIEVSPGTIRKWASRGRLTPRPPHPDDPRKLPRYCIGDIRALINEAKNDDTPDGGPTA